LLPPSKTFRRKGSLPPTQLKVPTLAISIVSERGVKIPNWALAGDVLSLVVLSMLPIAVNARSTPRAPPFNVVNELKVPEISNPMTVADAKFRLDIEITNATKIRFMGQPPRVNELFILKDGEFVNKLPFIVVKSIIKNYRKICRLQSFFLLFVFLRKSSSGGFRHHSVLEGTSFDDEYDLLVAAKVRPS
jgi:hypothetical protein